MMEHIDPARLAWAIEARARSQRLLLALYEYGHGKRYGAPDSLNGRNYSALVACAFSLWRAAFLADSPTRTWPEVLNDAQDLLTKVLSTNTISFDFEHQRQGWTVGYYMKNTRLRLIEIHGERIDEGRIEPSPAPAEEIELLFTDPHVTWVQLCEEAERLAAEIGVQTSPSLPLRP